MVARRKTLTQQDLVGLGASFFGTSAILGEAGDVSIIGLDWTSIQAGLTSQIIITASPQPGSFGFTDGTLNYAGFQVSGNGMDFYAYSSAWGPPPPPPTYTSPKYNGTFAISTNSALNFNLIGLDADPAQKTNNGPGGTFTRCDMTGNTLPYSLRYTDTSDIQIATRNAGGWYYVYNQDSRVVTRVKAWWGQ